MALFPHKLLFGYVNKKKVNNSCCGVLKSPRHKTKRPKLIRPFWDIMY